MSLKQYYELIVKIEGEFEIVIDNIDVTLNDLGLCYLSKLSLFELVGTHLDIRIDSECIHYNPKIKDLLTIPI
ncbi:hypothetical protein [Photobacterium minamisatsumaniensis]|uniref:hypothetical protein n=1 Tax=Photobacterium minamisatsumaniensis TaxID=2910233 RepID=UPI003D0FEAC9